MSLFKKADERLYLLGEEIKYLGGKIIKRITPEALSDENMQPEEDLHEQNLANEGDGVLTEQNINDAVDNQSLAVSDDSKQSEENLHEQNLANKGDEDSAEQKIKEAVDYLLLAVEKIRKAASESVMPGITDNIDNLKYLIKKMKKYDKAKSIGFFGAQNRGKSSLINVLLGVDLMPVAAVPMSSVVIKVMHDSKHEKGKYTILIMFKDGAFYRLSDNSLADAKDILEQYGARKGEFHDKVDIIEVTSNFENCKILENHGVFIDTPGAEVVFNEENGNDDPENNADAQRALKILASTHIVVFVESADSFEDNNSKQLFTEHLKPLRPFSVITKMDKSRSGHGQGDWERRLRQKMADIYGVNLARKTICVSSQEASKARADNKVDEEMLSQSNIPLLEESILKELENLDPKIGLNTCLDELSMILSVVLGNTDTSPAFFKNGKLALFVFKEKTKNALPEISRKAQIIYDEIEHV